MKKENTDWTEEAVKVADSALTETQQVIGAAEKEIEATVAPYRKSIVKRFPVLFLLAVTFGFTATVTGMEQLLVQTQLLSSHPTVIFFIGVAVLVLTGTVYKKLG